MSQQALDRYHFLDAELDRVRFEHHGLESEQEKEIMEEMDKVWWKLDAAERDIVNAEPCRSLIV